MTENSIIIKNGKNKKICRIIYIKRPLLLDLSTERYSSIVSLYSSATLPIGLLTSCCAQRYSLNYKDSSVVLRSRTELHNYLFFWFFSFKKTTCSKKGVRNAAASYPFTAAAAGCTMCAWQDIPHVKNCTSFGGCQRPTMDDP